MIEGSHNYTHNPNDTVAAALNQGGVDVNCGSGAGYYPPHMCDAVAAGTINMTDVDRAARRYWRTMMRLGMFDPPEEQPMIMDSSAYGAEAVDSPAARELAKRTAVEGIVLLKNDGTLLPMDGKAGRPDAKTAKIVFIGPAATMTQDLLSAPQYHGQNQLVSSHSPLMVAQGQKGWHVTYARGCNICDWKPRGYPNQPCSIGPAAAGGATTAAAAKANRNSSSSNMGMSLLPPPDTSNISAAVAVAKAADVAVLFLGADQTTEAENFDREDLGLVGAQEQLLAAVTAVQSNLVVVLIHGGPISVESAQESSAVRAIVDAFQPGELGADAIMDVLDGTAAPSGRMPYTTYFKNFTRRDIREVNLTAGDGLTYWWHTAPVLYPFGHSLSYTNWSFAWSNDPPPSAADIVHIPTAATAAAAATGGGGDAKDTAVGAIALGGNANHSVVVTNTGSRTSDVVVLAFIVRAPPAAGGGAAAGSPRDTPLRKLFGFERLRVVGPGESRTVYFAPDAYDLGVVGEDGDRRLQPGHYLLEYGGVGGDDDDKGSSSNSSISSGVKVTRRLVLEGAPLLVERSSTWHEAATA
eukprot:SAG31_NODE_5733_length_2354_cov_1.622616_1_plen_581_part_00